MHKGLMKKSQFALVTTSGVLPTTFVIEADEAYVMVPTSTAVAVKMQRQREKDLSAFVAANPGLTGTAVTVWGTLDPTFGRVPVDVPIDTDGNLKNLPITTAANDLKHPERLRHANVGIKETVTFQSVTSGVGQVIIELVHYVPASEVAA